MRKRWIVVGVALMAAVIFVSSSIPYDRQNIQPLLARMVNQDLVTRWFGWVDFMYGTKEISIAHVGVPAFLEFFIRKAAHLISYALLGYLMSRLLGVLRLHGWRNALCAIGLAVLYAASDEIHQMFTPHRQGTPIDVCLDACGAAVGVWLAWKRVNHSERSTGRD